MNIDDFLKKLETEFDDLEPGALKADSKIWEAIDLNSINSLVIITLIESEYDHIIDADELKASQTPNELFNKVIAKSNV